MLTRITAIFLAFIILMVAVVSCDDTRRSAVSDNPLPAVSESPAPTDATPDAEPTDNVVTPDVVSQTVDILDIEFDFTRLLDGSTACLPLGEALKKAGKQTPEREPYDDTLYFSKTHNAYISLVNNNCKLILVTYPSDDELALLGDKYDVIPVVRDALVFLNNRKNPVEGLTGMQIQDVYSGAIRNWSELGGKDMEIIPYQRPENSGSQTLFLKIAMDGISPIEAVSELRPEDMGGLVDAVSTYDNAESAIGYSVYYYATAMYMKEDVRLLSIDGVAPSSKSITSEEYPYGTFYYAVLPKSSGEDTSERKIVNYLLSAPGQKLAADAGYVPLFDDNTTPREEVWGFYGSTRENTTQSYGTGGSIYLGNNAAPGKFDKLSDIFYDGFNYIEYINNIIQTSLTREVSYFDSQYTTIDYIDSQKTPFTGIPNDYSLFDTRIDFNSAYITITIPIENPFFEIEYEKAFFIHLTHDISPFSRFYSIENKKVYINGDSAYPALMAAVTIRNNPELEAKINKHLSDFFYETAPQIKQASDERKAFIAKYSDSAYDYADPGYREYAGWNCVASIASLNTTTVGYTDNIVSVSYKFEGVGGPTFSAPFAGMFIDMSTGERLKCGISDFADLTKSTIITINSFYISYANEFGVDFSTGEPMPEELAGILESVYNIEKSCEVIALSSNGRYGRMLLKYKNAYFSLEIDAEQVFFE